MAAAGHRLERGVLLYFENSAHNVPSAVLPHPHNATAASTACPERRRCRCADGGNGGVLAGKTAQTAGRNGVAMSRTTTKQFQAPYASAGSPADDM